MSSGPLLQTCLYLMKIINKTRTGVKKWKKKKKWFVANLVHISKAYIILLAKETLSIMHAQQVCQGNMVSVESIWMKQCYHE